MAKFFFRRARRVAPALPTHSCATCGLLAIFDLPTSKVERTEVDITIRRLGSASPALCIAQAFDLVNESQQADKTHPEPKNSFIAVTQKQRSCAEWMDYQIGEAPQEHMHRRQNMRLENERRQWELGRERAQRHFDVFLAAIASLIGLAAIAIALLVAPKDSWLLCKTHVSGEADCAVATRTATPQSTPSAGPRHPRSSHARGERPLEWLAPPARPVIGRHDGTMVTPRT